jgi:hypothetical protein
MHGCLLSRQGRVVEQCDCMSATACACTGRMTEMATAHPSSRVQVWRLAWSMMSYQDVMENSKFAADTNYNNGLRQMEWVARWLRKARIKNSAGGTLPEQEFVVMVRC